ncbi:MAG: SDR family oxidoreductase [Myxococcales bacterium]|nr:SDR family oxidoreductase [Myxococcales bacterium]
MTLFDRALFADRVCLVTGGGSGIGAEIALQFARHGARVAVLGRSAAKLDTTVRALEAEGAQGLALAADVRDAHALEAAVAHITQHWGRLDVLVNAAAGNFLSPAATLSANGFRTVIDIDLCGTFNACRAAYAALAARRGVIVNITASPQGFVAMPLQCHAGAAKAGIEKLTRDLALEWGPAGVRVVAVAPGPIANTEGMSRLAPGDAAETMQQKMPLGRWGRSDEVASAVMYLASPAAGFITGTTLTVDGGAGLLGAGCFLAALNL